MPSRHRLRLIVIALAVALVATACGRDVNSTPADSPITESAAPSTADPATSASTSTTTTTSASTTSTTSTTAVPEPILPDHTVERALAEVRCPVAVEVVADRTTCHRLTVPQAWDDAEDNRTVEIAVAVVAAERDTDEAPVVFLNGGPGSPTLAALDTIHTYGIGGIGDDRDVVFFDQRGVGLSTPELDCRVAGDASGGLETIEQCIDDLRADGLDPEHFDSTAAAHDIEALRQMLEIDEWNVVGQSYGTLLGLVYTRLHPGGVRTLVLDSPVSPVDGVDTVAPETALIDVLNEIDELCQADVPCRERIAEVEGAAGDVFTWLFSIDLEDSVGNPIGPIEVGIAIGILTRSVDGLELVPRLMHEIAAGETTTLEYVFKTADGGGPAINSVAQYPIVCRDGLALPTFDDARCQGIEAVQGEPTDLAVPVAVLGGELDMITPAENAERLGRQLDADVTVVFDNAGHGVLGDSRCGGRIVERFLDEMGPIDVHVCADFGAQLEFFPEDELVTSRPMDVTVFDREFGNVPVPTNWLEVADGRWVRNAQLGDPAYFDINWFAPSERTGDGFDADVAHIGGIYRYTDAATVRSEQHGDRSWVILREDVGTIVFELAIAEIDGDLVVVEVSGYESEFDAVRDELVVAFLETFA